MSSFKSPEVHVCGRIHHIIDHSKEVGSFYVKAQFLQGEDWKLMSGNSKFETFESEAVGGKAPLQHPFNLHYVSHNVRGWPRLNVEVWKVDEHGRHKLYGYGTAAMPMASGDHKLVIGCWRPMGSWYDQFIGANTELQYPDVIASSLNRYGLRTISSCLLHLEVSIIGRNFQLHGVLRN